MSHILEALLEEVDVMFLQSALGFSYRDGALALRDVSPSTFFFTGRPERLTGHVRTGQLVDLWGEGPNNFVEDPPNAILSPAGPNGNGGDEVVLVLREPRLEGSTLRYAVEILEGELAERGGACALFIDPFGRPLAPAAATGLMRRRAARSLRR